MAAAGVISGYGDGTFRPNAPVTRGQMAALLYRAGTFPAGSARFPDTTGTTHEPAVAALADAGVIAGYPDGTFRPAAPISRAQMATMLTRAFDLPAAGGTSPFTDTVGSPHESGIAALAAAGITTGYANGTFRPTLTVTRGQTASFLQRALRLRTPGPSQPGPAQGGTVTHVVDGDTLDVTTPGGSTVRVRLVGIDTPERGQCGYTEATSALAGLTLNRSVGLIPGARDDTDRYGRLLRYVDASGTDPALTLLQRGLAVARYDSRDGYGPHPREAAYVTADMATPQRCPA
jgi:endonuclease YncB( thermonuclease family)